MEPHLLTRSADLFLRAGVFRLFAFNAVIDMLGLRAALLVVSCLSS